MERSFFMIGSTRHFVFQLTHNFSFFFFRVLGFWLSSWILFPSPFPSQIHNDGAMDEKKIQEKKFCDKIKPKIHCVNCFLVPYAGRVKQSTQAQTFPVHLDPFGHYFQSLCWYLWSEKVLGKEEILLVFCAGKFSCCKHDTQNWWCLHRSFHPSVCTQRYYFCSLPMPSWSVMLCSSLDSQSDAKNKFNWIKIRRRESYWSLIESSRV